jgi:hypothetical protein
MNTKDPGQPCAGRASSHRSGSVPRGSGLARFAVAASLFACAMGVTFPAFAQDANRLGLCTLDGDTVSALRDDVDADIGVDGDPEIAFVVVYSISNDNNGQPVATGTTGPILCTNPAAPVPFETTADTDIFDIDILDSAEAFLLRFEGTGGSSDPETRFCHTTNANVDCYLLGPPASD